MARNDRFSTDENSQQSNLDLLNQVIGSRPSSAQYAFLAPQAEQMINDVQVRSNPSLNPTSEQVQERSQTARPNVTRQAPGPIPVPENTPSIQRSPITPGAIGKFVANRALGALNLLTGATPVADATLPEQMRYGGNEFVVTGEYPQSFDLNPAEQPTVNPIQTPAAVPSVPDQPAPVPEQQPLPSTPQPIVPAVPVEVPEQQPVPTPNIPEAPSRPATPAPVPSPEPTRVPGPPPLPAPVPSPETVPDVIPHPTPITVPEPDTIPHPTPVPVPETIPTPVPQQVPSPTILPDIPTQVPGPIPTETPVPVPQVPAPSTAETPIPVPQTFAPISQTQTQPQVHTQLQPVVQSQPQVAAPPTATSRVPSVPTSAPQGSFVTTTTQQTQNIDNRGNSVVPSIVPSTKPTTITPVAGQAQNKFTRISDTLRTIENQQIQRQQEIARLRSIQVSELNSSDTQSGIVIPPSISQADSQTQSQNRYEYRQPPAPTPPRSPALGRR